MIKRNHAKQLLNRAVGYVRRSTDRQEQSIDDQKKAIEVYAVENGLSLSKFYIDDAISGTSTLGRKAFQQMIEDAESSSRKFDLIIVYDVKRFGRIDNDEAGFYRHRLRINGVEVCYISENFNGDTTDDLLRPVKQWQARQESKDLSKVTIRGLLSKAEGGWWMGGTPPYGYDMKYENTEGKFLFVLRFMPDGSKQIIDEKGNLIRTLSRGESLNISKRDQAKLILSEPQRVKVAKQIFQMYTEQCKGYKSIAHIFNSEGVPTPRGPQWSHIYSGKWTDTTIRAILVNPIYAGDMVWNRRTDARFHRISKGRAVNRDDIHGARLVPNDREDWIIIKNTHPPLINRRIFELAKQRLENHPKSLEQKQLYHGKTWNGLRSRYVLSGIMRCRLCNSRYQGITRTKGKPRLDGSRVKTYYYGCGGYITKGASFCQLNLIPQNYLEDKVIEAVLTFYKPYFEKDGQKKLKEAISRQITSGGKDLLSERKELVLRQQSTEGSINNLLDSITPNNREMIDQRLGELKTKREQIKNQLEELDRLCLSQDEIENLLRDAMDFLSGLEFTLRHGLTELKLAAIRQCIKSISVDKPAGIIHALIRIVPTGCLNETYEMIIKI